MVSALDSGASGPGSSPGWLSVLVTLTMSLSSQEYNCWGNLANCGDGLASHPGGVEYS